MPQQKDYYKILGVERDAAPEEIKRAYRKLARKHHPDVNPGDAQAEERFKEISEAYHVLGDKERRAAYDRGPERFAQEFDLSDFFSQFDAAFRGRGGGVRFEFGDLGDLFGEVFSGGGFGRATASGAGARFAGQQRSRRGRDVNVPVQLSFEEAVHGTEKSVTYRRPAVCEACGGSGRQGSSPCASCAGSGQVKKTDSARVKIPPGVANGGRVRVPGRGEPGQGGGPAGDLFLKVSVTPHPVLRREGSDLYVEVPVTIYEATLGAKVEVPTLNGSTRISLPAGTRNGQVIRLAGRGAPLAVANRGGEKTHGDLYVTVRVEMPEQIGEGERELMERYRDEHPYHPREKRGGK